MTPFPRTRIGEVFYHAHRVWRRGRGRYYVAHSSWPYIEKKYRARLARRGRKKVSPSTSRWRRRHEARRIA